MVMVMSWFLTLIMLIWVASSIRPAADAHHEALFFFAFSAFFSCTIPSFPTKFNIGIFPKFPFLSFPIHSAPAPNYLLKCLF